MGTEKRKATTRRHYSEEMKKDVVKLSDKIGPTKASQETGISKASIAVWRKRYGSTKKAQRAYEADESLRKRNKELEKENKYLRQINDVLKKSHAIMSKNHIGENL